MRSLLALLLLLLLLLGGASAQAEEIRSFHTTVTVKESGSLRIREEIHYDFGELLRHGIYRDIPSQVRLSPGSIPTDLGLSGFAISMDGGQVRWRMETIHSPDAGEMIRLRIGDPVSQVTGEHLYTIDYWVARGVFPASTEEADAIRWNVVGTGWNVPVRLSTAEFRLPPPLHRGNVSIFSYTGRYGSTGSKASPPHWIDDHRFTVRGTWPPSGRPVPAADARGDATGR